MKDGNKLVEFLSLSKVYFVGSPTDRSVLLAIHPLLHEETGMLSWWDTVKERMKKVKAIQIEEDHHTLHVIDVKNTEYIFTPLTLSLYNNIVKEELFRPKEFTSDDEMIQAFEET